MKYIAPFLKNTKYKVGDYIIYEMNYLDQPDIYKKAKIIKINKYVTSPYNILDEDDEIKNLLAKKIVRKMTEDEKSEYILQKDSKKYNI